MADTPGDRDLAGRVALVTGGSRGIGAAIAGKLAGAGAVVAINYRRDEAGAAQVARQITEAGGTAVTIRGDVTSWASCAAIADEVRGRLGDPDIFVHSAGVVGAARPVVDTEPTEVLRLLTVHAVAAHWLAKLLIPGMRRAPAANIVFLSSVGTIAMRANAGSYVMAKASLEALAQVLSHEEAGNGIRVNVVAPGLTETDMGKQAAIDRGTNWEELGAAVPLGRVCSVADIANLVHYLVSDAGSFITGQRIYLHGGFDRL
jgi:3-oxoacyl-[acyl-carrier protein] reductase